jgi:anti-sigma B factor antagonist
MPIRIREVNGISILDVDGRVDINSSDIIETVGWLTNTGKVNIIINFEGVDIVDYSGLSVLAIAYKNVTNHKGKLKLLNVPLNVIELFKVVKLETVFETYSDEESAVSSFYDQEIANLNLRRRFARLDIHLTVKYAIAGGGKKARMLEGRVLNMSAAGLYIYTPYTLPLGTQVDLEFNLPGKPAGLLEAAGKVSWLADKEIQPHFFPGMGVSFLHITSEKEKAIIQFIDKNVSHRAEPI